MLIFIIIVLRFAPNLPNLFYPFTVTIILSNGRFSIKCNRRKELKSIFKEITYDLYFKLRKIQNGGYLVQAKLTEILLNDVIYPSHSFYMCARKLVKRHSSFVETPARRLNNLDI